MPDDAGLDAQAGSAVAVLGRGERRLDGLQRACRQNWVPGRRERWGAMQGQRSGAVAWRQPTAVEGMQPRDPVDAFNTKADETKTAGVDEGGNGHV